MWRAKGQKAILITANEPDIRLIVESISGEDYIILKMSDGEELVGYR